MSENVTCTPHRATSRFHVLYEDFIDINGGDVINANALRVFEVKTDHMITTLRDRYDIPSGTLPHEDDLWLSVSLRQLERWSLSARGKSAYARSVAMRHEKFPSLIQNKFVRSRFIARMDDDLPRPMKPLRRLYRDGQGPFIVVDDQSGGYEVEGRQYHAVEQGYGRIERQFLYCIEAVREAIAALDYDPPPTPSERWGSISAGEAKKKSGGRTTAHSLTTNDDSADPTKKDSSEARRGSSLTSDISFGIQDITKSTEMSSGNGAFANSNSGPPAKNRAVRQGTGLSDTGQGRPTRDGSVRPGTALSQFRGNKKEEEGSKNDPKNSKKGSAQCASSFSLLSEKVDVAGLRNAPWTPETILALSSKVLDVPDFSEIEASGDVAAIEWWYEEWLRPAERFLAATIAVAPPRAWEEIDLSQRYMTEPGSPSWWRHRDKDTPITMAHVERNHKIQLSDARKKQWWPTETTAYDGPIASWLPTESPAERHTDELPVIPQLRSMSKRVADGLALRILDELPMLIVGMRETLACRFLVGIEIAPNTWHDFDVATWEDPSEELREIIADAVVYGEECAAGTAATMA